MALPVAFARGEDHRSGVFEHRDEVRHNERLGEEVFGGTEQTGALPSPLALLVDVILSVALPEGNVSAFQTFVGRIGAGDVLGPRLALILAFPHAGIVRFLAQMVGHQLFDGLSVGIDGDVIVVHRAGEKALQLAIDLVYRFRCEGLVSEGLVRIDVQFPMLVVQVIRLQSARSDVGGGSLVIGEVSLQPLVYIPVQTLSEGGKHGG